MPTRLIPDAPEAQVAFTAAQTAAALLNDDDAALVALRFDVRHIITFVTSNRVEQIEALTTLHDAALNNRLYGPAFWDGATQCGCAIGTICRAIGIRADDAMPVDHPRVAYSTYVDGTGKEVAGLREPATWFEAIRQASLVTLGAEHRNLPDCLFVETLLYASSAPDAVQDELHRLLTPTGLLTPDDPPTEWAVLPDDPLVASFLRPAGRANRVATARARDLLAQVAQELLDEVNALPEGQALAPAITTAPTA